MITILIHGLELLSLKRILLHRYYKICNNIKGYHKQPFYESQRKIFQIVPCFFSTVFIPLFF